MENRGLVDLEKELTCSVSSLSICARAKQGCGAGKHDNFECCAGTSPNPNSHDEDTRY